MRFAAAICVLLFLSACTPTCFDREIDYGPPWGVQTVRLCEFYGNGTPAPSSQTPKATSEPGVPEHYFSENELSKLSDDDICKLTLSTKIGAPKWDGRSFARNSVNEAKRRGLTPEACAKLLGRQVKEAPPKEGNIEERLTKLKNLYDKGLITQEEYENKQAEILEGL
jgi:hypothetical protein